MASHGSANEMLRQHTQQGLAYQGSAERDDDPGQDGERFGVSIRHSKELLEALLGHKLIGVLELLQTLDKKFKIHSS